jgi:hypothetical protein
MPFSEKIAEENWMEKQIENVLKDSNKELKDLKDLVLSKEKVLRMDNINITDDHVTNILKKSIKDKKTFSDVYAKDSA